MRDSSTDQHHLRQAVHPAPRGPTRCRDPIPVPHAAKNILKSIPLSLEITTMTSRNSLVLNSNTIINTTTQGATIMNARQLFTGLMTFIVTVSLLVSASLLQAAPVYWEGDLGTGWGQGVDGVDTNWSNNSFPSAADDLIFHGPSSGASYGGDLDLGGNTYAANSITVGDVSDIAVGGLSDFGVVNQIIGKNGTVQLGAGGIEVVMPAIAGFPVEHRLISIDNNIEVTADTSITRKTNLYHSTQQRSLYLGGVISGASKLDFVNEGSNTSSKTFQLEKNNTITGDVSLSGYFHVQGSGDFGDGNQLTFKPATSGYTYVLNYSSLNSQDTDYVFDTTNWVRLGRFGGPSLTLNGDITGGDSGQYVQIYTLGNGRPFIFAGAVQTFENEIRTTGGSKVIIANSNGSGIAWENVPKIILNNGDYNGSAITSDLLLRGDHTLNQLIQVSDTADTNANVALLGQLNDGVITSDATFGGRIDVQEDDYQALSLTADAGSSATFDGEININGGGYGLDKVGAGTVIINGRVSEDLGNSTKIGDVNVVAGTLQINSPAASGGFNASMVTVAADAILGGTGQVNADVVVDVDGSVAPGTSIGTLSVNGNVDINGALTTEVNGLNIDLLDVSGSLTLGASSVLEVFGNLNGATTYILAQSSSLTGTFSAVYFNGELLAPGDPIGVHGLAYLDNAVVLVGVPEPSSLLLLGMGACVFLRRGRKHGKRRVA